MSDEQEITEDSDRKKHYDDLWKSTPNCTIKLEDGSEATEYMSVPYKSNAEYSKMEVKEIPIDTDQKMGLFYNAYNSRILAHKLHKEAELGRALETTNKEDRNFLEEKLLTSVFYSGSKPTEDLEKELATTGQLEPAIISADGVIWNANRRIAIRRKLFLHGSKAARVDAGDPYWNKVKAVKLPSLGHKQLKQLEHRLQMAKTFKQDYGSITLRLRCREALTGKNPWTFEELNNSFRNNYTKKQIETFIAEINLMDEFLRSTLHPNDYTLVEGKDKGSGVEIFSALLKHLEWEKRTLNTSDVDIEKIKACGFALIHNDKSTYKDAREFAETLKNQTARAYHLTNNPVYQNFGKMTTTTDPKQVAPYLSIDTTKQVRNVVKKSHEIYEAVKDPPVAVAGTALTKLQTIKAERIRQDNDPAFRAKLIELIATLRQLMDNVKSTDAEKKKIEVEIEKIAKQVVDGFKGFTQ